MRRLAVLSLLIWSAVAVAQDVPAPLGERFRGPYDVSFKPFADAKVLERQSVIELARFGREDKKWLLVFARTEMPDATPLKDARNAQGNLQAGYLSATMNKLRGGDPNCDILRDEVIDLGDLRIGVLTAATHDRDKPVLLQEALMEVTPRLYYTLVMTSPIDAGDAVKSPAARDAAMTFKGILDSIERVDLSAMKQDQDERLFRARGLFAQWNRAKLLAALSPERYMRFKRAGKDVGYAYVVETPADALPRSDQPTIVPPDAAVAAGFRVGTRTHTQSDDGRTLDIESWAYVNFDRRHEVWSKVTVVKDPGAKSEKEKSIWFSEVGASDLQRERVFDRNLNHDDFKDMDQKNKNGGQAQPFKEVDKYKLTVRNEGRSAIAQPIERDLPPFYLPQALEAMLPRIVPLGNPTGYLFAGYNSDSRQIMLRYVDVLSEADVTLDGKSVRAVGVSTRVGFAGSATTHYFTRAGQYLGSTNADDKLEILPTDRATLQGLWKDIDLRAPAAAR